MCQIEPKKYLGTKLVKNEAHVPNWMQKKLRYQK